MSLGNLAKHAAYAPRLAILTNHQILGVSFVRVALLKAHMSPPEVVRVYKISYDV